MNNTSQKAASVIWYANKESLYAAHPNPNFILAKDINDDGAKSFAVLPLASMFSEYISTLPTPNLNEVIPETRQTPVYVYIDLDKDLGPHDDYNIDYLDLLTRFESIFTQFMQSVYNTDIDLQRGQNYQASYTPISPTKPKLSMHIKINIVCRNVETLKSLIINLDRYMTSNLYLSPEDRDRFYFYKLKSKLQKYTPLIDQSVYTNFRGYRTLLSSKMNSGNPLTPLPGFSANPLDHLVVCYNDIPQSTIPADIQNIDAEVQADYSSSQLTHLSPNMLNITVENRSETSSATAEIPNCLISQLESTIMNSPEVKRIFGTDISFKYNQFFNPIVFTFNIDKACKHICPYTDRTHKHNRSFFEYHFKYNTLRYKCYNEECQSIQERQALVFSISSTHDALKRLCDLNPKPSLHCKENIIHWNETYDHPHMFTYPIKPLTAIRANMGVGKTHALINNFINKHCIHPDTKCLFITYQILLSKKYHQDLKHFDFVNYHDTRGPIEDNKIIVCLDSLHRVKTQNFDFIFIDEVLSVLLHFNSSLMKQVSLVSSLFELLMLQARHVYLLDAAVDNAMVYNFVNYLAQKKNVSPYYIRNQHVKQSNRQCKLHVNRRRTEGYPKAIKFAAFDKVVALLAQNKKVVVSSSTKAFTKELVEFIHNNNEVSAKNIIVYNSESDKSLLHAHASNIQEAWSQYDAIIYSPTIGAGLSFDVMYFDNLVGYMDNSFKAPTVDLILQQLFRVRCLSTGCMDLFIEDSLDVSPFNYPTMEDQVEDWMDNNVTIMHAYFPPECLNYEAQTIIDVNGIKYDKTRLSYHILKGITANKNKSLLSYSKTIVATLQSDYRIPCKITHFSTNDDALIRAMTLFHQMRKSIKMKATIPFSKDLLINYDTYIQLERKEHLNDIERLQKWTYDMAEIWGVPLRRVDEPFFNEWIGQVYDCEKTMKKFYRSQRLIDALTKSHDENREAMYRRFEALVKDPAVKDTNIELFRTNLRKHYQQLIECQCLLNEVFGSEIGEAIKTTPTIVMKGTEIKERFGKYVSTISPERFKHVRELFGMDFRNYESLAKLKAEAKNQHSFIGSMLREGVGVSYYRSKRGRKNGTDYEQWSLGTIKLHGMVEQYKPRFIRFATKIDSLIIEDDGEDWYE